MLSDKYKKIIKICIGTISLLAVLGVAVALLMYNGYIQVNHISRRKYPVVGVDVSSYQGDIDWNVLASQNIQFAFIKATEGSGYVDQYFKTNWENAAGTDLRIGAYHFFSFESPGKNQASNFIGTVGDKEGMLPPVIDVEYYGSFRSAGDIDAKGIAKELRDMVDELFANYGVKPIIYVSKESYETIVKDGFNDCPLWYRSVYSKVPKDVNWTFWQCSNRKRLDGYNGAETYIDLNVFNGSKDSFMSY